MLFVAGLFGLVGFELSSDSKQFFSIDPKSGILSLRKSLDRERQDRHNVTIFAHDEVRPCDVIFQLFSVINNM